MSQPKEYGKYGWFIVSAADLVSAVVLLALSLTGKMPTTQTLPMMIAGGVLFALSVLTSLLGAIFAKRGFRWGSLACGVLSLAVLISFVFPTTQSFVGARLSEGDSYYSSDPKSFLNDHGEHGGWILVSDNASNSRIYDSENKVKEAILGAGYSREKEKHEREEGGTLLRLLHFLW